jgi:molecular chaperone DnaK (HSP70)
MVKAKKHRSPVPSQERRADTVPESTKTKTDLESLPDLFLSYADASRDAHLATQKKYYTAYENYVESIRGSLKEKPLQEAARVYTDEVHGSLVRQDSDQFNRAVLQYADAAQEAQAFLRNSVQDATQVLNKELLQSSQDHAETQKAEIEKFIQSFHAALSKTDPKELDAASLAKVAHTSLAAAWLRAQYA